MKTIRKCRFCGKEFVARNGMQKFCCEECQTKAKEVRKKRQQDFMNVVEPVIDLQCQEYLTFAKAALLMGCSRQYVYKLVNEGKLAASRISSRMAFIRKADIEKMLAGNPYHRVLPTNRPKKPAIPTTKKGKATTNSVENRQEAERINNTMKNELLKGMRFTSLAEVIEAVAPAVSFYNEERPHMSIDMMTPKEASCCTGELKKHWTSYREMHVRAKQKETSIGNTKENIAFRLHNP